MNEFIEQFLIESRELVERATDDLLALENEGATTERLDSAFRAVHTLKGAAGIIEFGDMATALHAAEETLSELRKGAKPLTVAVITACLECLDQVTLWLDQIQATGLAPENAATAANEIVRKFSPVDIPAPKRNSIGAGVPDWVTELSKGRSDTETRPMVALRYRPDAEAFFQGEDPLAIVAGVPGLMVVDLKLPLDVSLQEIDPYSCQIEVKVLISGSVDVVAKKFANVAGDIDFFEFPDSDDLGDLPSQEVRSVLKSQILLLKEFKTEANLGHLAAAGQVAMNVLRHAKLHSKAFDVESALAESLRLNNNSFLISAIENALKEKNGPDISRDKDIARQPQISSARAMRVDMERVDALVNLTGELTVVKNALGHTGALALADETTKELGINLRRHQLLLERLVAELQRAVLQIRVLPLRNVFQRLPRLIREISANTGKPVRLTIEGEETEADAAIVEGLFEPLLHIIRNSVDHGVEDAAKRSSAGKPATAQILLRARRHLEHVIVEVEDDGGGIDMRRVRQVAVERGLLSTDAITEMTDADVVNVIFLPGFSTASEVTNLSGRGVGMDSVKTAIERLGGTVQAETFAGRGTRIQLNLPFTIMMTRVLTVEAAGQVFGFPLDAVIETAMVPRGNVVPIGQSRAFELRNRTVPLISLADSLGLTARNSSVDDAKVVVASAGGQLGGIEVDELGDRMEVMLKPMEGLLGGLRGVAGTTLLGDGRVLIVLDVQELFQ